VVGVVALAVAIVLAAELANTAVERLADHCTRSYTPRSSS